MENREDRKSIFKECAWLTVVLLLLSCNNSNNNNRVERNAPDSTTQLQKLDTVKINTDTIAQVKTLTGTNCFAYTKNNDTILLEMNVKNGIIAGKLIYNLYEKDKNTGEVDGILRNDTLLANYTYMSEGTRSVRQIIFLVKGNILVQGSGSMKEQNGRFIFTDKKDINFNSNLILEPANCDVLDKNNLP